MIKELDYEIARLQHIRDMLAGSNSQALKAKLGRPKKVAAVVPATPAKRIMSAEGKARIAAAQKKRWAAKKRAS